MKSTRHLFLVLCWLSALAFLSLSVVSCQSDKEASLAPIPPDQAEFVVEEAYPGAVGDFETIVINGESVSALHVEDKYVVEGDMLFSEEAVANGRSQATGLVSKRWPDGVVYYVIDEDTPEPMRRLIQRAIGHWQEKTSVYFVERTDQDDYVEFEPRSSGCSSKVGMQGGRQEINISSQCGLGSIIHEIGHCMGLFHEHTRLNRDQHITINWGNVESGKDHNFKRADLRGLGQVKDWAGDMDYGSIMMYNAYAFSKNKQPTIVRKDGKTYTAQRNNLSNTDIKGIDNMYGKPPVASNFPDPNKWYRISSQSRNYALHDANREVEDFNAKVHYVVTLPYRDHWEGQRWRFVSVGDGYYRIYSQKRPDHGLHDSGKPYSDSSIDAFYIFTAPYQGFSAQKWRLISTEDGYYRLVSQQHPAGGLNESNRLYENSDEARYILSYTYRDVSAQKWKLQEAGSVNARTAVADASDGE